MKPEAPPKLHLDEYTPYLLNRAGSRIAVAFTEEARRHGVSLSMWRVLAVLHDHGPLRLGDLAEATSIETSTLSRLVQQMTARGFVKRSRAADDLRAVKIRETDAGRAVTATLIPLALDYERRALAGFDETEIAELKGMLRRLFANMAGM